MRIAGRWRITEAQLRDCDALNLVAPAFIEFAEDGSSGSFGFIAVQGRWTVARWSGTGGRVWSWEGNDECNPANGRGWAVLEEDGSLCGRIFFHLGDDSARRPRTGVRWQAGPGHFIAPTMLMEMPASRAAYVTALCSQ